MQSLPLHGARRCILSKFSSRGQNKSVLSGLDLKRDNCWGLGGLWDAQHFSGSVSAHRENTPWACLSPILAPTRNCSIFCSLCIQWPQNF